MLTSRATLAGRQGSGFFATLIAVLVLACAVENREIPAELHGVWRTTDLRFADRFLELGATTVVFGSPEPTSFAVSSVRLEEDGGRLNVEISYDGEEHRRYTLQLVYLRDSAEIELTNRAGARWRRDAVSAQRPPVRDRRHGDEAPRSTVPPESPA